MALRTNRNFFKKDQFCVLDTQNIHLTNLLEKGVVHVIHCPNIRLHPDNVGT